MPRVSVLMPSFNHGQYLHQCVESIRSQVFTDWELVVVDDGSRDDSVEILQELSRTDARIHVHVNETNLGTYGTLQRALGLAAGTLIAIINSDDYWHPDKLSRQVESLDRLPNCRFCYVLGGLIDGSGELLPEEIHRDWPRTEQQELLPFLMYENRVLASGVLFRRENLRFEPTCRYSGDWVALIEQAYLGPAAFIEDRLTFWRIHLENAHKRSAGQILEELRVRNAILLNAKRWYLSRIVPSDITEGLAKNSVLLFDLAIHVKARSLARRAVFSLAEFHGKKLMSMLKRSVATFLPAEFLRKHFQGESLGIPGVQVDDVYSRLGDIQPLVFQEDQKPTS